VIKYHFIIPPEPEKFKTAHRLLHGFPQCPGREKGGKSRSFSASLTVKKASQSFAAAAAKGNPVIFCRDRCVAENTLRGASVELAAAADNRGAERSGISSKKRHSHFFEIKKEGKAAAFPSL